MLIVTLASAFAQFPDLHSFNSLFLWLSYGHGILKDPLSYCLMLSPHCTAFYVLSRPLLSYHASVPLCYTITLGLIFLSSENDLFTDCKNYDYTTKLFKYKSGCSHLNLRKFLFPPIKVKAKLQADQDKPSQSKSDRCQSQCHAKVVSKTVWLVTSSRIWCFLGYRAAEVYRDKG